MAAPGATQRAASKFIVFENFEKMNTAASRQGLPEKELAWQENLQAISPNKLVTVPAPSSSALATLTDTTMVEFFASIGGVDYIVRFSTSGAAYLINIATGVVNNFAPAGTFSDPDVTTWQAERILINDPTAGYCTYDGSIFVRQGRVSPVIDVTNGGSGYSSAPSVAITGGSGTGATAHSVISGGEVVAVILDSPGTGYNAGDTLTVTFGTGVGSGATGHVTLSGFGITSVLLNNPGSFVSPSTGTVALIFSGGGGSGAAGTAVIVGDGSVRFKISSVSLSASGSGYSSLPTVTIASSGGTAPSLTAVGGTQTVASIVLDTGGSLYVTPPSVSIQGGGATTAATAHSTISAGAVNSLVLDTAGAGYTSLPTVVIGTGSGAAATARIWPFVPEGTTLAVFQGRVWLGGDTLLQYTGTRDFDDFDPANAAGSLLITDADLVHAITALRSYNNYLFIMGDQSVKQIGNISLNAAGTITLFTVLTLSSDQGTIYKSSCVSFNRVFMFANKSGVYAVLGSSVQKISGDMDGIWSGVDFSQSPQAALIELNGIHNVGYLIRYADPFTSSTRSLILTFNGQRWFPLMQGASLRSIVTTSTLASGQTQVYGSSGTDIRQLLADSDTAVAFRLQTSLSHHGNSVQGKKMLRAGFAYNLASGDGTMAQKVETEGSSHTNNRAIESGFHMLGYAEGVSVSGVYLGQTLTGTLKGLTITAAIVEFQETALWPNK